MREANVLFGSSALLEEAPGVKEPCLFFPGRTLHNARGFGVDDDTFGRHILLLGGSGCGKTNTFFYAIDAVRRAMDQDSFLLIFDPKGDYYRKFYKSGDYVIGNSAWIRGESCTWNLFGDVLADGWAEENFLLNARELSASLFHGRGSTTQPFFCNAARDIFYGILIYFICQARDNPSEWGDKLNNKALVEELLGYTVGDYRRVFDSSHDLKYMNTYIGDGSSTQALGVFAELNSMVSEYLVGIFAGHKKEKSVAMRRMVRARGARAVFVEYDLSLGETLSPLYRLLLDLALKEALGAREPKGKVYVFADEFKILPKIQHIDDALNFGRSQGIRLMAGIQSIDQLYDIYGRDRGAVIAAGFGSLFAFHTNDHASRAYITKRFGENLTEYSFHSRAENAMVHRERSGNTVESWDQLKLGLGQAFVALGYEAPFLFEFEKFGES